MGDLDGLWILDLETIPAGLPLGGPVVIPQEIRAGRSYVEPEPKTVPRNWTDPAKIRRRERENAEAWAAESADAMIAHEAMLIEDYARLALRPLRCEIAAVALHPVGSRLTSREQCALSFHRSEGDPESWLVDLLDVEVEALGIRGLLCWGGFDPPVLRAAVGRAGITAPSLSRVLRLQSRGAKAWFRACADPAEWTVNRLHDYRRGWALKHTAREHGITSPATVPSGSVFDAWAAGDAAGVGQRAAEDVRLVSEIIHRERLHAPIASWWGGVR